MNPTIWCISTKALEVQYAEIIHDLNNSLKSYLSGINMKNEYVMGKYE